MELVVVGSVEPSVVCALRLRNLERKLILAGYPAASRDAGNNRDAGRAVSFQSRNVPRENSD